jgi:hypothetical protein
VKTELQLLIRGSDTKVAANRYLVKAPDSNHIQLISIPRACLVVSSPANTIRPWKFSILEPLRYLKTDVRRLAAKKEAKDHAVTPSSGSSGGSRCPVVAGKSIHPYAVVHQIDFDRRTRDCRSCLAAERFWSLPFPISDAHRVVKDESGNQRECEILPTAPQRNTAANCLKEIL